MNEYERTGVGDEAADERDMTEQPGLSGGEFPGAEERTDEMSEELTPAGETTAYGGRLGDYGPEGTIGTVEPGSAS